MAALGVFGLLQLVAVGHYVKSKVPSKQFKGFLMVSLSLITILGVAGLFALTALGWIAPWTGRFYSLWDTNYAKIHIPIIASVSVNINLLHGLLFSLDTNMLIWLFPAGIYLCFQELRDEHVFVIIYGVFMFLTSQVLWLDSMLTLTPIICVSAAIALSKLFDVYLNVVDIFKSDSLEDIKTDSKKSKSKVSSSSSASKSSKFIQLLSKAVVLLSFTFYLVYFVYHCTWVTSNAYSSPSVVLASRNPDGSQNIIDD